MSRLRENEDGAAGVSSAYEEINVYIENKFGPQAHVHTTVEVKVLQYKTTARVLFVLVIVLLAVIASLLQKLLTKSKSKLSARASYKPQTGAPRAPN